MMKPEGKQAPEPICCDSRACEANEWQTMMRNMHHGVCTLHQSCLKSNLTALRVSLMLGLLGVNNHLAFQCIPEKMSRISANVPSLEKIGGSNRFCRGFLGEFVEIRLCKSY